jgi:hypothetical protein
LGPLLFALALHPLVALLNRSRPSLHFHAWYLDDGTLIGTGADIQKGLDLLLEHSPSYGLHLNLKKSELFCLSPPLSTFAFPGDLPQNHSLGTDLLGAPISNSPEFCDSLVSKRLDKIQLGLTALSKLDDPQAQLILLRACAAWPKFNFITRVCDPKLIPSSISRLDDLVPIFSKLIWWGLLFPKIIGFWLIFP